MSICFTWFPFGDLGETNYTTICGILQELRILLGGSFDCEELVGVAHWR